MSGHLFIFAIDTVIVFGTLLMAAVHVPRMPRNPQAWLVGAIFLCNACAVVLGRYDYSYWIPEPYRIEVGAWKPVLNIGRNLTPALFMLFCHSLFQEPRRFPRWILVFVGVQVLLEEPIHLVVGSDTSGQRLLTEALPALLQALFTCLAIYWTAAGWTFDLVEVRRRMRGIVLALTGLLIIGSVLLLRVVIPWDSIQNYYANVVMTMLNALLLSFLLLWFLSTPRLEQYLNPGRAPETPATPTSASRDVDTAAHVARLRHLMEVEQAYRQPRLSVGSLASQMVLPEYRLRKLIHEELGYRNFNAFLHHYRIGEACRLLRDPAQRGAPILTIALGLGYQSINTFNRGFREVMGVTPTVYRAGSEGIEACARPAAPPESLPES